MSRGVQRQMSDHDARLDEIFWDEKEESNAESDEISEAEDVIIEPKYTVEPVNRGLAINNDEDDQKINHFIKNLNS
jgi:hypothetical protein